MEVTVEPVGSTDNSYTSTGTTLTEYSETTQHRDPLQTSFPQSSFVGLRSLLPRGGLNEAGPSSSRELPRTEGSTPAPNGPSVPEHPTLQGLTVAENSGPYQRSPHLRLQRQRSAVQPPVNPTNPRASGINTTSTSTTRRWRDPREDIEAQRGFFFNCFPFAANYSSSLVLETIRGDSLSRENMEAYIETLRKFGGLGN